MKILFVVSGIGYGDATREHANIVAIKKKFPDAKILVAGYDNSYKYFRNKYDTIKIRGYKLPGKAMKVNVFHFALKNLFLPAFWFFGTLKVRLQAFNFIPDIIVSDFEPVGISLGKVLFKKCVVVFAYDPMLYEEYAKKRKVNYKMKVEAEYFEKLYNQSDIVAIPTFRKIKKKRLGNVYIDPIVRTLPNKLPSVEKIMKELRLKKKPILVMLGGSEFGTKLAENVNKVAEEINEDFIIFGGNLKMKFSKNVKYYKYNPDFLKYLKVCKGVISLAGHKTLSEALIYKKAVLCFPIQDHIEQVLNAYALEKVVMVSNKNGLEDVKVKVNEFVKRIPDIEKKVVKLDVEGKGSQQVAELIGLIVDKS